MKIGFDAKRLLNNYTGLGNYSRTLVKNIAINFPLHKIYLYATHINKNSETSIFYDNKIFSLYIAKSFFKSIWRSFGIVNQLIKDKIEIYHGLSNELPFGIKKTGIKTVVTIHDLIFKIYPKSYPLFDRIIYDSKFRYACNTADKIIAISEQTKKDIIRFYNVPEDKIEVVYQSCHEQFFNTISTSKNELKKYNIPSKYNLYVGSVNERKNLKTLIHAYKLLHKNDLIPLVIIGKGKIYKQECIELIKHSNLESSFIWVNNLHDVRHLQLTYLNANCFIYPSLYEGFGIPIIEALLCGTPVITSNISSLPEAAGENSLLINPTKPQEIADSLHLLNSNTELRANMIEKGRIYAIENFDAVKTTKQLNNKVYSKLKK